jgi:hypothetical protein
MPCRVGGSTKHSDAPKRWIGRFLMDTLLATARSSVLFVERPPTHGKEIPRQPFSGFFVFDLYFYPILRYGFTTALKLLCRIWVNR